MCAQRIEGKAISDAIRIEIGEEAAKLAARGIVPGLAVVLVGDDPASKVYVGSKEKACQQLGFYSEVHRLDGRNLPSRASSLIDKLNKQPTIHGYWYSCRCPSISTRKPSSMRSASQRTWTAFILSA